MWQTYEDLTRNLKPAIDVSEKNKPQFFGKITTTTQQLFSLVIFFI